MQTVSVCVCVCVCWGVLGNVNGRLSHWHSCIVCMLLWLALLFLSFLNAYCTSSKMGKEIKKSSDTRPESRQTGCRFIYIIMKMDGLQMLAGTKLHSFCWIIV